MKSSLALLMAVAALSASLHADAVNTFAANLDSASVPSNSHQILLYMLGLGLGPPVQDGYISPGYIKADLEQGEMPDSLHQNACQIGPPGVRSRKPRTHIIGRCLFQHIPMNA